MHNEAASIPLEAASTPILMPEHKHRQRNRGYATRESSPILFSDQKIKDPSTLCLRKSHVPTINSTLYNDMARFFERIFRKGKRIVSMNMNGSAPSVTVESIKFKNGTDVIRFNDDDIVLLVGANNVGKSRTLKDLQEDLIGEGVPKVLIDEVGYRTAEFTADQLRSYFERNISKDEFGNYTTSSERVSHFATAPLKLMAFRMAISELFSKSCFRFCLRKVV